MPCNDLPQIEKLDGGTIRRLRVVKFLSKFVDNPDPSKPNEYQIDKFLNEKLLQWPEIFMRLLLEKYKIYKKEGIIEPPEVVEATKEYEKDCNLIEQFLDDMVFEDPKSRGFELKKLTMYFKMWFNKCGDTKKMPGRKELKKALIEKYGVAKKNRWKVSINSDFLEKDNGSDSESDSELFVN